tara:strand:+ start:162 stop:524 length:363 start_codon:yes stop_codon:yes gene_type:complete
MSREFRKLLCLDASEIDVCKVGNNNLQRILGQVIVECEGDFIFWGKGKHHNDHGDYHHQDERYPDHSHADVDNVGSHTDHSDHNDYTESSHSDNSYSESSYHTDSYGGHEDYSERSHRDS